MTRSEQWLPIPATAAAARHRVAVLLYAGMTGFELGVVADVFGLARPELDQDWYDLRICSPTGAPVRGIGGLVLHAGYGPEELAQANTVIVPGVADVHGDVAEPVLGALRTAHRRGARIVSICSGAFALAAAGLLDGRRATTHWRFAATMARRYPQVMVDPDVLWVDEGPVLTGAGSAAGIDLCLHLVRADHGSAVAAAVARRMVVAPFRDGGQAQYVAAPVAVEPSDGRIAASMSWALEHLAEPIGVAELAWRATMSPRSYARHFGASTGTTPVRWLNVQRVQRTLRRLEDSDTPVQEIADGVGLDAVTYRRHFREVMATTPSAYRRAFRDRMGPPGRGGRRAGPT